MLVHDFFKIPIGIALGVALGLLVLAIVASIIFLKKDVDPDYTIPIEMDVTLTGN